MACENVHGRRLPRGQHDLMPPMLPFESDLADRISGILSQRSSLSLAEEEAAYVRLEEDLGNRCNSDSERGRLAWLLKKRITIARLDRSPRDDTALILVGELFVAPGASVQERVVVGVLAAQHKLRARQSSRAQAVINRMDALFGQSVDEPLRSSVADLRERLGAVRRFGAKGSSSPRRRG